ncbi:pilus assembly protein TadG-related protein [Bradyrhizobium sp. USDA 4502]
MRSLLRCRRGSVAFATVVALVPLIGMVALGAEAGSWYATKQHAQTAADAAAYSSGLTLACSISGSSSCDTGHDYVYRGKQFAAQNTFCNSGDSSYPGANCVALGDASQTVTIDRGSYAANTWTSSATGSFVRVAISQQQPAYLARVLGLSTVNISAQAIVEVKQPKELCALGLGPHDNALTIGGSSNITGNGCGLMSDNSVKYNSTPTFSGSGWAVNGVTGCVASVGHCALSVPYNYNMLPATNPLKVLNTETFNSRTGTDNPLNKMVPTASSGCPATFPSGIPTSTAKCYSVSPNSGGTGAYKDLTVSNNDWVDFAPGTYFFYNATIKITGGTVTCSTCTSAATSGVTLVLLGTTSTISMTGGTVNLSAAKYNNFSSDLNGVLIDDQAQNPTNASKIAVNINGGATSSFGGAMYFPYADVSWGGGVQNTNTTCTEVIANTLTINGNAYMSTNNCAPGTVAHSQVVALVH